jgi:hypothetical protein
MYDDLNGRSASLRWRDKKMVFIASEYLKGLIAILWPLICPGDICIIVFGTVYLYYTSAWIIRVKSSLTNCSGSITTTLRLPSKDLYNTNCSSHCSYYICYRPSSYSSTLSGTGIALLITSCVS